MEYISFELNENHTLIGNYYNRKMFGHDTLHKNGEWKSLINHKEFYHLLIEMNGFILYDNSTHSSCVSCPIQFETLSSKNITKTGTINFVLFILLITYFLKSYKKSCTKFILKKSKSI